MVNVYTISEAKFPTENILGFLSGKGDTIKKPEKCTENNKNSS